MSTNTLNQPVVGQKKDYEIPKPQTQTQQQNSTFIDTKKMAANEETKEKIKEVTLDSVAKNMKVQPQKVQQVAPLIDQEDFFLPDPKARKPEKLDLKFVTSN